MANHRLRCLPKIGKNFRWVSILFLAFFVISNCSFPTQYVRRGIYDDNGYVDKKIDDRLYEIEVTGNISTDGKRVLDIFLLRAAKLADKAEYPYFMTAADQIDLDLEKLEQKNNDYKKLNFRKYTYGFTSYTVRAFVLMLDREDAIRARRGNKTIQRVDSIIVKKSYLLDELDEYKKAMEEKEKKKKEKKKKPISTQNEKRKKELEKIDEELGLRSTDQSKEETQEQIQDDK